MTDLREFDRVFDDGVEIDGPAFRGPLLSELPDALNDGAGPLGLLAGLVEDCARAAVLLLARSSRLAAWR